MEFNEKLQELRRQKGLTQEELAAQLFVSRAAVSKWESGRGYPGIDSLKSISKFFSVSIDALLSGDELITLAEEEQKEKQADTRAFVFGLMDVCTALLFILPVFAERSNEGIRSVSLLSLNAVLYARVLCILPVALLALSGILTFAFRNHSARPLRYAEKLSPALNCAAVLIFIAFLHPYAAVFAFFLLLAKVILLLKRP